MLGTPTIYFDIDDTLLMWGMDKSPKAKKFVHHGISYFLVPHKKHIAKLKQHKKEGWKIVVWSHGGEDWAKLVVKKLKLT
jgi:FMN phosphatase YigB (HAD superfamily)